MPYYYFHLCKDSRIVAHDMKGRDCENDEAALQHAQDRGVLVILDSPISGGSDYYEIQVKNETGKDIVPLPLPSLRSGDRPNCLRDAPTMQSDALKRSALCWIRARRS
jgi:hypothetical protein